MLVNFFSSSPESPWDNVCYFHCVLVASKCTQLHVYLRKMFSVNAKFACFILLSMQYSLSNCYVYWSEGLIKTNAVQQTYTGFIDQYLKIPRELLRLFIFFRVTCRCFIFICRAYLASQSIMSSDLEQSSQQCLCLKMSSLTHSGLSHLPMCTSPRQRRSCCWAGWMGLQSLRLFQMSMVWTKLPDYSCVKDGHFNALTNVITWKHKFIYL